MARAKDHLLILNASKVGFYCSVCGLKVAGEILNMPHILPACVKVETAAEFEEEFLKAIKQNWAGVEEMFKLEGEEKK